MTNMAAILVLTRNVVSLIATGLAVHLYGVERGLLLASVLFVLMPDQIVRVKR